MKVTRNKNGAKTWTKRRRQIAQAGLGGGEQHNTGKVSTMPGLQIIDIRGKRGGVYAVLTNQSRGFHNPSHQVADAINDALDPTKQPSKVKTLATMSPEQRAEMERLYGKGRK